MLYEDSNGGDNMKIKPNLTPTWRAVRIAAGLILLGLVALAFIGPRTSWAWLGLIGIIPLTVGITGC